MANLSDSITGFVAGDDIEVSRVITEVPIGQTLTKAWLTVKRSTSDADPGLLQKVITTTNVPGTGQVTDDADTDGSGEVRFDLTPADTVLLAIPYANGTFHFDIQVMTSAGKVYTPVAGTIVGTKEITKATS